VSPAARLRCTYPDSHSRLRRGPGDGLTISIRLSAEEGAILETLAQREKSSPTWIIQRLIRENRPHARCADGDLSECDELQCTACRNTSERDGFVEHDAGQLRCERCGRVYDAVSGTRATGSSSL
jgi:predicted transcriptional regulator